MKILFCRKAYAIPVWIVSLSFSFLCTAAQGQSASGTTSTSQRKNFTRVSSSTWTDMKEDGYARKLHAGSSKIERTYDAQGRITKILEPDQDGKLTIETDYTWNAQGKLMQIVQQGKKGDTPRIRTFTYDKLNHLTSYSSPENGTTTYTYLQNGKLATKTDARGIITNYTWDQKGNLVEKQYSNGDPSTVYVYDDKTGKLSASYLDGFSGPHAKRTYFYNDQGKLDHLIQQGKDNYDVSLAYDTFGHTSEIHYPDGRIVLFLRDDKGNLVSIADNNGTVYLSNAQYSTSNELQRAQLGNSLIVETGINRQGNLSKLRVLRWGSQRVLDKHFSYTRDGSILTLRDNINPANTLTFSYDNLLRVSGYSDPKGNLKHDYSYDAFGNINLKDDLPFQLTYDSSNRINSSSGLSYDQAGEMTFDGTHQYQYDAEGRISQVDNGAIQYVYSAEGDRLEKSVGKTITEEVRVGNDVIAERSADGSWTDYLYAAGRRIAAIRETGVRYYVADPLGTTRTELSASGEVISQSNVSPFGKVILSSTAQAISFTSGEQYDMETGLISYKYRSYNPVLGRWMSPDPSGERYANLKNPQTLNTYAYVANNPLKYTDLLGLEACDDGGCDGDDDDDCTLCDAIIPDDTSDGNGGDYTIVVPGDTVVVTADPDPDIDPDPLPYEEVDLIPEPPSGGASKTLSPTQLSTRFEKAKSLVDNCLGIFSKKITSGYVVGGFSKTDFDNRMTNLNTYIQKPDTSDGSNEASTLPASVPIDQRKITLYADYYYDTSDRQSAVLVHEMLHLYTGWTDANIFSVFQYSGMTQNEVKQYIDFHNTDGITTWILRGCHS